MTDLQRPEPTMTLPRTAAEVIAQAESKAPPPWAGCAHAPGERSCPWPWYLSRRWGVI